MRDDDTIRQVIEAALLGREGKRIGQEWRFLCAVHDDHHPSAQWNPGKMVWTCYACGSGGGWKHLATALGLTELLTGRPVSERTKRRRTAQRQATQLQDRQKRRARDCRIDAYRQADQVLRAASPVSIVDWTPTQVDTALDAVCIARALLMQEAGRAY